MKAVRYLFHFENGQKEEVALTFAEDMHVERHAEADWTRLDFHRCEHCPLTTETHCPFATALSWFIQRFDAYFSYEKVVVHVVTDLRTVSATRALQHGLASLLGLVGASSGCPHLSFFRPMARFHLPFASEQETLVRAFSFHLLGHYLAGGQESHFADLEANYHAAAAVNRGMADRLRAVMTKDAAVNALVVLDTFAQAVPYVVEEKLEEFGFIFAAHGPGQL